MKVEPFKVIYGIMAATTATLIITNYFLNRQKRGAASESELESSLSEIPLWKQPGKGPYGSKKYR
ncbi:hypothetical protein J4422_02540 [Candidatus Pacearchaeota archaeon]|nr:hypothetical protein [Candidatus Pacearchaeota archaeon]